MSFSLNHFLFSFSLQFGEAEKWWAMGENRWAPPFSLLQNHSNQTPFPPKISHIFSPLISILLIFTPTKHSFNIDKLGYCYNGQYHSCYRHGNRLYNKS